MIVNFRAMNNNKFKTGWHERRNMNQAFAEHWLDYMKARNSITEF